jgi:hypothetical protein
MRIKFVRHGQSEPLEMLPREILQRFEESLWEEALEAAEEILPPLCTFCERAEAGPGPVTRPGRTNPGR